MDPRERFAELDEALRVALQGRLTSLWTALPGIVQSFDPVAVTVVVQPALKGVVQSPDGSYAQVNLPLLPDVPVVFPRGGGCTLTFPVKAGDECLVVFSSRCIDGWWQNGGVQLPMEPRMHDLSDGFAILGPQSQTAKIANISTTGVQLRTNDGSAFLELDPGSHLVTLNTTGNLHSTVGGDAVLAITGDLTASTGGDANVSVGGDVSLSVTGSATGTIGSTCTLTASAFELNGPVTVNGTLNVSETVTAEMNLIVVTNTTTATLTVL